MSDEGVEGVEGDAVGAAGLSTGAVARRLGVSPTTLRSWDRRYGLGPALRSQGRHRRWGPRDVAMVEEMCRLAADGVPPAEAARVARLKRGESGPVVPSPREAARRGGAGSGLPLGDVRRECRGLGRAAVRLDSAELAGRLLDSVARHGLVTAWEEVMVPTLRAVGRKWESSGDRYVEVEHLLSWQISTALRRAPLSAPLPYGFRAAGAPPVLLACAPDEQHSLALEALDAALEERGVPTRMLGAAVPAEALLACVRRTGPAAVVLWAQARTTASPSLARRVAGVEWGPSGARGRPLVLPAGPGWEPRVAVEFPHCASLASAVRLLGGLPGAEGAVRRPARPG
ncbi:MerR family transcriptional regulator [Streptomyces sp. NPDC093252]|uniref:MerR family transcriptional regulator n=1 Tax=Streptomyces sp. NPDC093252 TaxID=3154980 RepID=UPI00342932C2